jgi:hypothetical protein
MSTYGESSFSKDIVETRRKSKIDDESSSSDESSMPVIGMEIRTIAHIEQFMSFLELPEDYEIACDDTDFTYPCITTYLQDRRWRQQDLEALHKMNDFVDEIDFCGELEYDFEDFPDSDEDDESDCCDDLQDSIRLTRSRFCKGSASERSQNDQLLQDCYIE